MERWRLEGILLRSRGAIMSRGSVVALPLCALVYAAPFIIRVVNNCKLTFKIGILICNPIFTRRAGAHLYAPRVASSTSHEHPNCV